MKKTLSAICLLLSLVSCTKKLQVRPDPSVDAEGRTSVVASVDDFAGEAFVWPASARIGIYDSEGRSNCRYTLMNEFAGKSGEVSLYGAAVSGPLVAYYPFTEKGYSCIADRRQPVLREQKAGSSAMEHLALNTVLVAEDEDGVFRFSWRNGCTGLLHLTLKCPLEGAVEKVVFQCPGAPLAGNVALDPDAEPLVTDGSAVLTLTAVVVRFVADKNDKHNQNTDYDARPADVTVGQVAVLAVFYWPQGSQSALQGVPARFS